MTPEQQQAAARVAVHQIRNAERMLFQSCRVITRLIGTGYVTGELAGCLFETSNSIRRLLTCLDSCIDNVEQSDRVEE